MKNEMALGAGPLAAILLGFALIPLREVTPAANLAFAFMALVIVTAELGGRAAAVATALTSALSLDFFLTRPYLRLAIEDHNDIATFVGLAVCGLVAARLGSYRREQVTVLGALRSHRQLLRQLLESSDGGPGLAAALGACLRALPLAGAVIRDPAGRLVASAQPSDAERPAPAEVLQPGSLLLGDHGDCSPLPAEGARISLTAGQEPTGWLDIWGDGQPADAQARGLLSDFARLVSVLRAAEGARR
jgi:hypothetical protein